MSHSSCIKFGAAIMLAGFVAACGGGGGGGSVSPSVAQSSQRAAHLHRMSTESTPPVPIPSSGAYFGARVNPSGSNDVSTIESETEALETTIGRTFGTGMHYLGWNDLTTSRLGEADFQGDLTYGRIPVISWECGDNLTTITDDLNNQSGTDYTTVENAASAIKNFGSPVFIRFFWEFNIDLNNEGKNGDSTSCFTNTSSRSAEATEFIGAWDALVTAFQNAGATNVAWLWNPAYDPADTGDVGLTTLATFLPGSSYVDWIGLDAYDHDDYGFDATISPFYNKFGGDGYPIMIGETGELQDADSGDTSPYCTQAQYFPDATYSIAGSGSLSTCASDNEGNSAGGLTSFPNVKGFMYFDAEPNSFDWILANPSTALTNFSTMANTSYFTPTLADP